MTTTPQKSAQTRVSSRSHHGYVNLGAGWRRPTEDFGPYGDAFRKAGQTLAQRLSSDPAYDHLDACPIVFLYRQALELYLKAIARSGQCLCDLEGRALPIDESILLSHSLSPFLVPLRVFFDEHGWSHAYEDCASFVTSLETIDPLSFAFRYPVDKKDRSTLPSSFVFNVLEFSDRAEGVLKALYELLHEIEACVEQATQILADASDWDSG